MAHQVTKAWFESRVERIPEAGCWIWNGMLTNKGYGKARLHGRSGRKTLAHRVAWELYRGPIQSGLLVCHHCDVPSCVNPAHLFVGTQTDNMADASRKGRCSRQGAEFCGRGHSDWGVRRHYGKPERYCRVCKRESRAANSVRSRIRNRNRYRLAHGLEPSFEEFVYG